MITAANNMADLMIQMSEFSRYISSLFYYYVIVYNSGDDPEDFIQKVHLIVRESQEIVTLANSVCEAATDHRGLKKVTNDKLNNAIL